MKLEFVFAVIVALPGTVVHTSGLMSLGPGDLTRLLILASLPEKELEKEVRKMFFRGLRKMLSKEIMNREFLELRELFSLRRMLNRTEQEELPGDITIIAMLVTDGDVRMKYVDSFEWDLGGKYKYIYEEELVKILIEEMETNRIYASMQRATVASVVELPYYNAGIIIAGQGMGSQYWNIPGRWRQVFEIMLSTKAIREIILDWGTYDTGVIT